MGSLVSLLALSSVLLGQTDTARLPPIVAVVGDDVVTRADLERQAERTRAELARTYPPAVIDREWPTVLRRELAAIVDQELVLQLVRKEEEKLVGEQYITEGQIDSVVESQLAKEEQARTRLGDPEEFYDYYQKTLGWDRRTVRKHLRRQMSVEKYVWKKVFSAVPTFVKPNEAYYYYRDHESDFASPVEASFRMIDIGKSRPDFRAAFEGFEAGLEAGEDFVKLAQQWSDEALRDPSKAGQRVWKKTFKELEDWQEPIRRALSSMKEGQVSPRVETPTALYYLKVEDLVDGTPKKFKDVQHECNERIVMERRRQAELQFKKKLREKVRIEIFLPPLPGTGRSEGSRETPSGQDQRAPSVQGGGA